MLLFEGSKDSADQAATGDGDESERLDRLKASGPQGPGPPLQEPGPWEARNENGQTPGVRRSTTDAPLHDS